MREPGVDVRPARGETRAVVLLLHGGKEHSQVASEPFNLSSRRMRPFARAIHRTGAKHGVAVWLLLYRVKGWNGEEMSPVPDARWALDEVRRRHGDVPVVLVGHSMGGRTGVRVLDDPNVVGMVALAPWLPNEAGELATERSVLIAQGTSDHVVSLTETSAWAERAQPFAKALTLVRVSGAGHFLLRRISLWTDLVAGYSLRLLGVQAPVGSEAMSIFEQVPGTLTV